MPAAGPGSLPHGTKPADESLPLGHHDVLEPPQAASKNMSARLTRTVRRDTSDIDKLLRDKTSIFGSRGALRAIPY
jgi:hypothetical protein